MDTQASEGVYLGQRTVSGEYLVGSAEGVLRPRTVYRVPLETRWKDNLSLVTGLPWKHNAEHEVGEEVMLDAYMPEHSPTPVGSPLPPVTLGGNDEGAEEVLCETKGLRPAANGIGWTPGCKGCDSISGKHTTQLAHNEDCRLGVIEKTKSNPVTAARINSTRLREDEYWSKTLEEEKEKEKKLK